MQSSHPDLGKNQSSSEAAIPGITLSESWRAAFGKLTAGCMSDAKAVVIIGERGVGKAALVDTWKTQSHLGFNIVTLDDATGEPDQVVADLAHLMGVDTADLGRSAILTAITSAVQSIREGGRETVVVLENADNVPANTVELLMVLARDRTSPKPLIRYIFSGSQALRKTMRLDGGTARRHNYVVVEMERFSADQTRAFAVANLARNSDITIADEAASYLHESTSGKPANILSVLDKVQNGRMSNGETVITLAHIQSLVKAPRPIGAAPKRPEVAAVTPSSGGQEKRDAVAAGAGGSAQQPTGAPGQKSFAEPGNVFATNADLPDSIRNVNDPRPLLRWAFGLDEHSETEALNNRAEATVAARKADGKASGGKNSADLNAALAQVAAREQAERNPQPEVLRAPPRLGEDMLDNMIESEAFAFQETRAPNLVATAPDKLKEALRDVPPPRKSKSKLVLATGVLVMGVASLGVLWTALKPAGILEPTSDGTPVEQTASADAVVDPVPDAEPVVAAAPAIGGDTEEPNLAAVITQIKQPDLQAENTSPDGIVLPFRDSTPRALSAAYLAPSGTNTTTENSDLQRAILDDMAAAERVELAGEEKRLMDRLAALESQVAQKQSTLSSLERAINSVSSEVSRSWDVLDGRNAEIEVAAGRLAFMARDRAQAAERLESATTEAQTAEERLLLMRDELAAAEALIAENRALLDEGQAGTANLGEALASRQAEYDELTRKVTEAEGLLVSREADLEQVLARQSEAEVELTTLQGELGEAKATQEQVEADLARLTADRDAQIAASEALNSEVEAAEARLASANEELDVASSALVERNTALRDLEGKTEAAEGRLGALVSELEAQSGRVTTSNQEVTLLNTTRSALEAELASKTAEIEKANGQLEALTANRQTASSQFEALTKEKQALEAELSSGTAVLDTLSADLADKQSAVDELVAELNAGTAQIEAQRAELESLKLQAASVIADQNAAQAAVDQEQTQVASATGELATLQAERDELTGALEEIEARALAAEGDLNTVLANKADAEAEIDATVQRLEDIKSQELAAKEGLSSFSTELETKKAELTTLEERILSSNQELAAVLSKREALSAQLEDLTVQSTAKLREQQAQLDLVAQELETKQAALNALSDKLEQQQVAATTQGTAGNGQGSVASDTLEVAVVPAIRVRPTAATPAPSTTAILDTAANAVQAAPKADEGLELDLTPRDVALVADALTNAPGLGRAPQEKKDQLQAALVRGECVTDALKETFGRVNPHTLVALLENMEMCGS